MLILSESTCEIVDFKTGDPSPAHTEQILIYSLLWAQDAQLNPTGRLADKLTLSYPTGTVSVSPLSRPELDHLERTLILRTEQAERVIRLSPPKAIPNAENCAFCGVRQLCNDYWLETTQSELTQSQERSRRYDTVLTDVEVEIAEKLTPTLWRAKIVISRLLSRDQTALVRVPHEYQSVVASIEPGARLRIIGALIIDSGDENSGTPLIKLAVSSEVFVL